MAIWFFIVTIVTAGFGIAFGTVFTAISQGNALTKAVESISRQPEASGSITTTLIIGLAFIESLTIYVLVVALILLFANPFTEHVLKLAGAN